MDCKMLKDRLYSGEYESVFKTLYPNTYKDAASRYADAVDEFEKLFGDEDGVRLFTAPGRT